MLVHVVVSVFQGCPEGVKVYTDKGAAEQSLSKAQAELGIEVGAAAESENAAELFYNVPVN